MQDYQGYPNWKKTARFHGKNKWDIYEKPKIVFRWYHRSGLSAIVEELKSGFEYLSLTNEAGQCFKSVKLVDRNGNKIINPDYTDIIYDEATQILQTYYKLNHI